MLLRVNNQLTKNKTCELRYLAFTIIRRVKDFHRDFMRKQIITKRVKNKDLNSEEQLLNFALNLCKQYDITEVVNSTDYKLFNEDNFLREHNLSKKEGAVLPVNYI